MIYSRYTCFFVTLAGIEPTAKEPESFILSIKLQGRLATQKYKIIPSFCIQSKIILQPLTKNKKRHSQRISLFYYNQFIQFNSQYRTP